MTVRELVTPSTIETTLSSIWNGLAKLHKTKASLFNLIIFTKQTERTNFIHQLVEKIVEKFPSRIIFISYDPSKNFINTAVSVVIVKSGSSEFACDQIDIGVGGDEI